MGTANEPMILSNQPNTTRPQTLPPKVLTISNKRTMIAINTVNVDLLSYPHRRYHLHPRLPHQLLIERVLDVR